MSEPTQAAGADAPQPVILDAVAAHLRRRVAQADNEALMLAVALRDLNIELQQAYARIAELEAKDRDHG